MTKPADYIREVKHEMTHVNFPSRKKTFLFTVLVAVFSIVVALFLGLFDIVFKSALEKLLNF